jgi:hypothetical protein
MFQFGVIVVALAVLLSLATLAMAAARKLGHPLRALLGLVATLLIGLVLILD